MPTFACENGNDRQHEMKKLLLTLLCTAASLGAAAQTQYSNPVITRSAPDPTVIRVGSLYYLYATEDTHNVPIYASRNLTRWSYIGTCFTDQTRPQMVPGGGIWAPDINQIGDKFVLYYSKSTWGGEWECGIGVATSDSPRGPFTDVGPLFISSDIGVQNSIDPFYIEDNGRKYLFWGSFRGIYCIELADDGLSVKAGATKRHISGTLTEGTYIHKHGDYYYLIGSVGSCCEGLNSTYHMVVARARRIVGPYYDKHGRGALNNYFEPLLDKNERFVGVGHCSEIVQDDAGQDWILYHGYDTRDGDGGRKVFLDRVTWDEDGWPRIGADGTASVRADAPLIGDAVAVDELIGDEAEGFIIRPHTVRDSFSITPTADRSPFRWQVIGLHGDIVKQGEAQGSTRIAMDDTPEGLYVVSVKGKKSETSQKILRKP